MTAQAAPLLVAEDVIAGYRASLPIVHGASLQVARGEILVVLGPNGAGKSTLVKALAGTCPLFGGRVRLDGDDIGALPAHRVAAAGVGFVPQTANIFTTLSVEENLRVGGHLLQGPLLRQRLDDAWARFPDLLAKRRLPGHALSGGQRQMLALARALMMAPRVLMLDEPSAGLSPLMVGQVFRQVRSIADSGIAVLMVEQNVKAGLAIADRGLVLVGGRVAHEGAASALQGDPLLAELYLGHHGGLATDSAAGAAAASPAAAP
jgi:branched-chain amino acid transport system ATP-binding protein